MFKRLNQEENEQLKKLDIFSKIDHFGIQPGWLKKVEELGIKIEETSNNYKLLPRVSSIKSKFGKFRFYYMEDTNNKELIKLIEDYTNKINNTCEYCGSNDNVDTILENNSFVVTLCKNCKPTNYKIIDFL